MLTLEVEMPRRGYQRLEPPTLVLADPFGLHRAAVPGPAATPVMVLPRIEPVEAEFRIGGGGERAAAVVPGTGGSGIDWRSIDFEIDGLRPYRDGTPASRIHWPTVARAGELVERRLTGGGEALPAIVLDSSDPPDSESLDMAVRAAASLCAHMAARGGCLLALPGERRARRVVDPGGWRDAHAALALVGEGPLCPAAASLAARTACLISASAGPPAAGPARVAGCFVSPAPRPGLRTLLTVAGCHLQVERSRPSAAVAA